MPEYKAPLRDMRFVLYELLDIEKHYQSLGWDEVNQELADAILDEGAKFASQVLAPLNRTGDEEGCRLENGEVSTPKGFKEAYRQYCENGWSGMAMDPEYGGQGLPPSLAVTISEMTASANMSFGMYPGLSAGANHAISSHGTEEQKKTYLPPMNEGRWSGTMCLTESHCGTDLGLLRTKAVPADDGSYRITGEKIFISAGDHDMTDNVIHLVLARLPDAPEGTRGISLFIVPKFQVNADGSLGARNKVECTALEHKMGIKASATCVMAFEDAVGYLIGPPHKGLRCMFTMMNVARIGTGLQGLAQGEAAFQGALTYAKDRLQMRSLNGPKYPEKPADPIIVHPDVRRMLLTQKVFAEGGRALSYEAARLADISQKHAEQAKRDEAESMLGFLTPICKAFLTDTGFESTVLGMQVFGGHGYIREHGMEQLARDCRISQLYEGCNGIQALDLLGRKVLGSMGQALMTYTSELTAFCQAQEGNEAMQEFVQPLRQIVDEWTNLTMQIGTRAMQDRDEAGAASVDYLHYSGYAVMAYLWARMASVAHKKLAEGTDEEAFYKAKLFSARFFYKRILPRQRGHVTAMEAGAPTLMDLDEAHFSF